MQNLEQLCDIMVGKIKRKNCISKHIDFRERAIITSYFGDKNHSKRIDYCDSAIFKTH